MAPGRQRANGEGSIFPYRNGYAAYVWVTTPDGVRRRKWAYGKTREDVHGKRLKLHHNSPPRGGCRPARRLPPQLPGVLVARGSRPSSLCAADLRNVRDSDPALHRAGPGREATGQAGLAGRTGLAEQAS